MNISIMTNIRLAHQLIQKLIHQGVKTFCICPSSRNAPLIEVLTQTKQVELFQFYDERATSFFALGRSQRDGKPVGVVTTSGTAVCELLPAVCEAYYSRTPLVLITADRPSSYQDTAAPQSIKQVGLFSKYVTQEWDLEIGFQENLSLSDWDKESSVHINVRFDEPLIDENVSGDKNLDRESSSTNRGVVYKHKNLNPKDPVKEDVEVFFQKSKKPVIFVSGLPLLMKKEIEVCLKNLNYPIYAEPLSQIRESECLQHLILKSGEDVLKQAFEKKLFDGVIRIGSIPVLRFWRDLSNINLPVLSLSLSGFSGLKNQQTPVGSLKVFLEKDFLKKWSLSRLNQDAKFLDDKKRFLDLDQKKLKVLEQEIPQRKEWAWFRWMSESLPENSHVFLGNSLPIREWDLCATRKNKNFRYSANRGANGIDGLISTFLGQCSPSQPNYCIIGDLSALYDLSAPWIINQLQSYPIHIIVINNFGGQIFKDKFENPVYLNQHKINFEHLAYFWKLKYKKLLSLSDSLPTDSPSLIEIPIEE